MFIAMNRFHVKPGCEAAFEDLWARREVHIDTVPGFVEFHLVRGPARDESTLYSSHVVWESRETFEAWTRSDAFRAAHRTAGQGPALTLGHPVFEGFEVVQTLKKAA